MGLGDLTVSPWLKSTGFSELLSNYKHPSFFCALQILCLYKLKVCGNPALLDAAWHISAIKYFLIKVLTLLFQT